MEVINKFSIIAIPLIIMVIVIYGLIEKKKVFDMFIKGAIDGAKIVASIFPTLLGLFMAVSMLRSSGVLDLIVKVIMPLSNIFSLPQEILPLVLLRPISRECSNGNSYRYDESIWG